MHENSEHRKSRKHYFGLVNIKIYLKVKGHKVRQDRRTYVHVK